MAYSSGTFSRLYNFVNDRDADILIRADRMDGELNGMATALSTCILKDGTQTITANIPWNDYRITGLGDATADTDALNRQSGDGRYVQQSGQDTVTVATDDFVLIQDTSDSGAIKKVTAQSIGDLGGGGGGSGDEWGDAVDADIIPDADGTRDLGNTSTRFAEAYTDALFVTDNITVGGTVDGRDIATDGTKLDNIEAAADVTDAANVDAAGAVMEADYDANTILAATSDNTPAALSIPEQTIVGRITSGNIDALSASETRTLLNVEDGATADQTGAEIKTALFAEADTNNYDDAAVSKLAGIEANATADQTDEEIQDIVGAMLTSNTETRITVTYEDSDGTIDFVVDDDLANYDNTNSAFLTSVDADDIAITSEAQGDILYRGSSGWERLAAGTSGQFLKTLGTGADPTWDTLAGGGDMLASNNLSDVANAATAVANLNLTSTSNGEGASLIGLEDAGGNTTETDVEAAIAELYSLVGSGGGAPELLHIQDQKSSGTDGGTFTSGADRTRDLNTVVTNEITGALLSSNQITLPAGTYDPLILVPGYRVTRHRAFLYNVTDSVELVGGTSGYASATENGFSHSIIKERFTLSAAKVLEVRHRGEVTKTTFGFGVASNFGTEIYTDLQIRKVA